MQTKAVRGRGAKTKRREKGRIMAQKLYLEKLNAEYEKKQGHPMKVGKRKKKDVHQERETITKEK